MIQGILACLVAMGSVGCIAQGQHDDLMRQYHTCEEQNEVLRSEIAEARARIQALSTSGDHGSDAQLSADLAQARSQIDSLQSALDSAKQQIRELAAGEGPLPAQLDSQLAALAATHPGLMSYDDRLGMIKLASDLTFDLGSDRVGPKAADSLQSLADILNGPIARDYEVRVVGHTDNVRIANPATKAKHPTNWHLSAHRAISVKDILSKAGVANVRIGVGGHGEHRPIQPNRGGGNRANRRVEIFLVPLQSPQVSSAPAPEPEIEVAEPAPEPDVATDEATEEDPASFK
ncbi:MAG: hypothetical protein CMJ18_03305 [Phycisphaeraceae bacterium]|nr:hypothetical protein [Phycisphaeraceae bacterium]